MNKILSVYLRSYKNIKVTLLDIDLPQHSCLLSTYKSYDYKALIFHIYICNNNHLYRVSYYNNRINRSHIIKIV